MRIANATDLFGNPYLTSVSAGDLIDSAVDSAVSDAMQSGGYVRDSELAGKIETMGGAISSALDSGNYLSDYLKEENLAGKLEELGYTPGGSAAVPSEKIEFTSADSEKVAWSGNVATFTHGLNGMPAVVLFDNDGKQVLAEVVYVSASTFTIDFGDKSAVTGTWTAVVYRAAEVSEQTPVEP